MNTIADITKFLESSPRLLSRERDVTEIALTSDCTITMIEWDELNLEIDALCAEFKNAQLHARGDVRAAAPLLRPPRLS